MYRLCSPYRDYERKRVKKTDRERGMVNGEKKESERAN